jgi:hypothetical protein
MVFHVISWKSWWWLSWVDSGFAARWSQMIPSMFGVICDNDFQGQKGREKAMGFYLRHYERVRRVVPKEMLLEYSI